MMENIKAAIAPREISEAELKAASGGSGVIRPARHKETLVPPPCAAGSGDGE